MPSNSLVSQAAALIRAGHSAEARQILLHVLKDEPQNESAWLWLVQSLPNDAQRIAALEQCLRLNPGSEKARLGLAHLRSQGSQGSRAESTQAAPADAALPPVPRFIFDENSKPDLAAPYSQQTAEKNPASQAEPGPQDKKAAPFIPFQPFQDPSGTVITDDETDLGLHKPDWPLEMAKPAAPAVVKKPDPAPFVEKEVPGPSDSAVVGNIEQLRKTTRNNEKILRFTRWILRTIAIILLSATLFVGGWYAWQIFGGRATDFVFIQAGLLPSLTPTLSGEPTLTPTPTRSPTETPTPTPTATRVPPTLTPVPSLVPRPAASLGKILFVSNLSGGSAAPLAPMALVSVGPDGSKPFQVIKSNTNMIRDPAWSADGSKAAYAAGPLDGSKSDIYIVNADGSSLTRLTTDGAGNTHPSWSPDGKWLVFSSKRDGNPEIYVMTSAGGKVMRLTFSAADDLMPAWSPDGTQIAFVSSRSMAYEIYTLKIGTPVPTPTPTKPPVKTTTPRPILPAEDVTRLTFDSKNAANPSWSADGKSIAYSTDRDGNREIYSMSSSGQRHKRLTANPANDDFPSWSPDGAWIAFTSSRDASDRPSVFLMLADGAAVYRFDQAVGSEYSPVWAANPKK